MTAVRCFSESAIPRRCLKAVPALVPGAGLAPFCSTVARSLEGEKINADASRCRHCTARGAASKWVHAWFVANAAQLLAAHAALLKRGVPA